MELAVPTQLTTDKLDEIKNVDISNVLKNHNVLLFLNLITKFTIEEFNKFYAVIKQMCSDEKQEKDKNDTIAQNTKEATVDYSKDTQQEEKLNDEQNIKQSHTFPGSSLYELNFNLRMTKKNLLSRASSHALA